MSDESRATAASETSTLRITWDFQHAPLMTRVPQLRVFVDGRKSVRLTRGQMLRVGVTAGQHTIAVRRWFGIMRSRPLTVALREGETVTVRVTMANANDVAATVGFRPHLDLDLVHGGPPVPPPQRA